MPIDTGTIAAGTTCAICAIGQQIIMRTLLAPLRQGRPPATHSERFAIVQKALATPRFRAIAILYYTAWAASIIAGLFLFFRMANLRR